MKTLVQWTVASIVFAAFMIYGVLPFCNYVAKLGSPESKPAVSHKISQQITYQRPTQTPNPCEGKECIKVRISKLQDGTVTVTTWSSNVTLITSAGSFPIGTTETILQNIAPADLDNPRINVQGCSNTSLITQAGNTYLFSCNH